MAAALKKNCARMAESAEKLRRLEQVILGRLSRKGLTISGTAARTVSLGTSIFP